MVSTSVLESSNRLINGPTLPKTIAPSPGDFAETFGKLAAQTNEILSIHISGKLSGTYNSALVGKEQLKQSCRVEVVDSLMASMGVGLLAIIAAKAALAGADLEQVTTLIYQAIPRTHYFGLIDSLEYLRKGGRLGKGQAFLGSILNIKPLLHIQDGEVYPLEKVRSRPKALARVSELVKGFHHIEEAAIMHTTTPDEARQLGRQLALLVPEGHMYEARVGPTIGTYLGPGTLTIALIEGV
jgi:DegV family protein with EDD domain